MGLIVLMYTRGLGGIGIHSAPLAIAMVTHLDTLTLALSISASDSGEMFHFNCSNFCNWSGSTSHCSFGRVSVALWRLGETHRLQHGHWSHTHTRTHTHTHACTHTHTHTHTHTQNTCMYMTHVHRHAFPTASIHEVPSAQSRKAKRCNTTTGAQWDRKGHNHMTYQYLKAKLDIWMAVVPSAEECSRAVLSVPSGDRKNCMEDWGDMQLNTLVWYTHTYTQAGSRTRTHTHITHTYTHLHGCVKPSVTSVEFSPIAMQTTIGQDGSMGVRIRLSFLQWCDLGVGLVQTDSKHACFNHIKALTVQGICVVCRDVFKYKH